MAIEALIERHWDDLLSLREGCLAQMLSTKPADREKLEQAIADIYKLAGMEPPKQIIWFDSQIDARLCIAMWIFMLDPFVHALSVENSPEPPYSKLWLGIMDFFEDANKELREDFPTLYTDSIKPELILSERFDELFHESLYRPNDYEELLSILATEVNVLSRDQIKLAIPDGAARLHQLMSFIENPDATKSAMLSAALNANLAEQPTFEKQEMFGPASSMNLRSQLIAPINDEVSSIIENGKLDRLFAAHHYVRDVLRVRGADWEQMAKRISTIAAIDSTEFRNCLAQNARGLAALNCTRSAMGDALLAGRYRALEMLDMEPIGAMQPLIDSVDAGGWWWPFEDIVFACDNPMELHVNEKLKLHNENGMAVRFRDGWGFWALNDVVVSEKVVRNQYSAADIDSFGLARFLTREVMIRRFGLSNYLKESTAREFHRDEYGILYRNILPNGDNVGIIVTDPISDFDFDECSIRVPSEIATANDAVAWVRIQSQFLKPA